MAKPKPAPAPQPDPIPAHLAADLPGDPAPPAPEEAPPSEETPEVAPPDLEPTPLAEDLPPLLPEEEAALDAIEETRPVRRFEVPAGLRASRYVIVSTESEPIEFGADARVFILGPGRNNIGQNPDGSAWLNGVDCPGWSPLDLWKQAQSAFLGRRHSISFLEEEF